MSSPPRDDPTPPKNDNDDPTPPKNDNDDPTPPKNDNDDPTLAKNDNDDNVANDNVVGGAAALISPEDIQNLNTIQDFDVSTSENVNDFMRFVGIPGRIKDSELNILLWLILEHELQELDKKVLWMVERNNPRPVVNNENEEEEDDVDNNVPLEPIQPIILDPDIPNPRPFLPDREDPFAGLTNRERRRTASYSAKSRKQIEYLLRTTGYNLPFQQLSVAERKSLFQQLANSSVMLPPKYDSVPEILEELRTRSRITEEFIVGDRLGGGSFGDVYEVTSRESHIKYAAKRISLSLNCFEEMRMTLNESRILKSLSHENVIRCSDSWLELKYDDRRQRESEAEPLKFYVLMEFCYQSFSEWIIDVRQKPDLKLMVLILKQILDAVRYLHSNQILHFDINTRNILWQDEERTVLKIGDFGLAIKGDSFPYQTGTPPYAAPECVFTYKSDIFSLGVTILEIAENIATTQELIQRLTVSDYSTNFPFLNNSLPIVLSKNPNTRPSVQEFQTMLTRVLNPTRRQVLELEPEDFLLLRPPVPDAIHEEDETETEDDDDQGNGNEDEEDGNSPPQDDDDEDDDDENEDEDKENVRVNIGEHVRVNNP